MLRGLSEPSWKPVLSGSWVRTSHPERKAAMIAVKELSASTGKTECTRGAQVDAKLIPRRVPRLCSTRYRVAFVAHFANFILMAHSCIINITMVAMVNSTEPRPPPNGSAQGLPDDLLGGPPEVSQNLPAKAPVYDWSPQIQGVLFSSAQYGMVLLQAPAGFLAGRVGTKKVVGLAILASSLLTLCIPLAAHFGLALLIAARVMQGLTQGTGYGGQFALWQRWAPPHERSTLCGISLSGMVLGIFTVILLGGIISQALGWPFVFYIFGGVGCVFCFLWFVCIYDDPGSHPRISIPEREYILSSLDHQVTSEKQSLPIKAMLRSLPLWSICFCSFCHQCLVNLFVMYTPTYISFVYKVNIRDNGLLSSLPFLVAWFIGMLGGQIADFFLAKNFRLVTVRKIATVLGNLPPAALIVALPYVSSSYVTTVTFLTLSCGLAPLCQAGIYVNALDIAPRYASFLMGASRGLAHMAAVLVPIVCGLLLTQDPEFGWRNIFFLLFAINLLGLVSYLLFGRADVQEWAMERKRTRL